MGEIGGFKRWKREPAPLRPVDERLADFEELALPRDEEQSRRQGGRCMECGIPFCEHACPLGNPIPDFNDLIYRGRLREAYQRLAETNEFPELTGRLCPAPCEPACVLGRDDEPVTIEQNEQEIAERAFAAGWVQPRPPRRRSGKAVAIVGSGPAGLAAAAWLNRRGHRVTIYEAADRAGGLLRYGIPDFKLDKRILDRRLALLQAEGIEIVTGARVGAADLGWTDLRQRSDALLVAIGASRPRELEVPGRELCGVHQAMDYLVQQNRVRAGLPNDGALIDAAGRQVVILGGGDTGADCLGTALRQGAASVRQIELLEQPPRDRATDNPWPEWPQVLRTSPSHREGGERSWGTLTTELVGQDGALRALRTVRVALDETGRLTPIAGSKEQIAAELLILAMGFVGADATTLVQQLGVGLAERGAIAADAERCATAVEGVFCAGDARRGASLVVWAIAEGRRAARAIHGYLGG